MSEGTCKIQINGAPETQEEMEDLLRILPWVLEIGGREGYESGDEWVNVVREMCFAQPYGGEPVEITLTRTTKEEYEEAHANDPAHEGCDDAPCGEWLQWLENRAFYTNWTFFTNYSDSMTLPWFSPIYKNDGVLYMNPM